VRQRAGKAKAKKKAQSRQRCLFCATRAQKDEHRCFPEAHAAPPQRSIRKTAANQRRRRHPGRAWGGRSTRDCSSVLTHSMHSAHQTQNKLRTQQTILWSGPNPRSDLSTLKDPGPLSAHHRLTPAIKGEWSLSTKSAGRRSVISTPQLKNGEILFKDPIAKREGASGLRLAFLAA